MNEDFYIELIYKKLTGVINTSEEGKLTDWLNASEENQLTEQAVTLAWNQSENLGTQPKVDLEDDFKALETRIANDEKEEANPETKEAKRRNLPLRWLSIAAGIAMLLIAGFFLSKNVDGGSESIVFTELNTGSLTKTIVLSDGTQVNLNKDSYLKYPEKFNSNERKVFLEGEAFFEVTHNPSHPFIVETKEGTVKVLGTSFNVRAFPKEGKEEVQVATGRVEVEVLETKEKVILIPGNKSVLDKENKTLEKHVKASANSFSWHSQELVFEDTPIHEVLESIEKHYGVTIVLENENIANCPFNSKFKNDDIEVVLATISDVLDIEIIKDKNSLYQMRGGKCE